MGSALHQGMRGICVAILLCAIAETAAAQTATPAPSTGQTASDGFADGDVLKITAFGRDDLTGTYGVQPGPLLSLPLIGTVDLTNRTPRQLEADLAKAWENRLGSPMSVTVDFAQRAPFYVVGAVKTPGAYPSRFGLTVLQAIAVSGGLLAEQSSAGGGLGFDVIRERERRQQAAEKLVRAQLRQARLLAERDGKAEFALAAPVTLLTKDRVDAIMAEEARLLDSRARQYHIKEQLLSDQIRLGEAQIASYQQQMKEMDGQQNQLIREANRIRKIPGQQARSFELEQRSTSLETTKASLSASIARTKVDVETARNGIADMQEARQREITEALLDTSQTLRENELTVTAAQDALTAAGIVQPGQGVVFKIVRNGKEEAEDVQPTTVIKAGDVLEVGFAPVAAPAPAAASN